MVKVTSNNGVVYYRSELISCPHGFSTRIGGVSTLPHTESLNLGIGRGDPYSTVIENLTRFANAIGVEPSSFISADQIQSANVRKVAEKDKGEGYYFSSTESWDGKLFVQLLATSISAMIRARIKLYLQGAVGAEGTKNYRVFYDSDHKLLAKLNNIYMTRFKDGWIFDEVVGKTKELFKILNLPLPTCELIVDKSDEAGEPQDQGEIADIEEIALEMAEIAITDL